MDDLKQKDDLKLIKDKYGEKMAHLCRRLFPSLLETKGLLFDTLSKKFQYSRELYNDIVSGNFVDDFRDFIIKSATRVNYDEIDIEKTPYELLEEAGYTLYECNSEAEIQSFKTYYEPSEELCTFKGGRLDSCYVFFAVKKDVDEIKRKDFANPQREDRYGTSVIGIQFNRGENNYVSIKNRYNHTVQNPDATFSNDLDNIIPGLTSSFKKYYGFKIDNSKAKLNIPGYVETRDGKYYKYNYQINNKYYCNDNILIENYPMNEVNDRYLDKNRYLIFDYFALDLKDKKVVPCDFELIGHEGFINVFIENSFDKVSVVKNKEDETKTITLENEFGKIMIKIDKNNCILSYYDDLTKVVDPDFLNHSMYIKTIDLPNAEIIRDNFLNNSDVLEYVNAPNVKKAKNKVLSHTGFIKKINMPNLEIVGDDFLKSTYIESIELNNLVSTGKNFLNKDNFLKKASFQKLINIGNNSLSLVNELEELNIPNVTVIGNDCLTEAKKLKAFEASNLEESGTNLLKNNTSLELFAAPKLKKIRKGTLFKHRDILPKGIEIEPSNDYEDTFKHNFNPLDEYRRVNDIHVAINEGRNR